MRLTVENLVVEYQTEGYKVRPLDGLDFTAESGELVVLLGPSGSGKTTLLSCLAGILTPTSGTIDLGGTNVASLSGAALADYRRSKVGIVFQASNLIQSLSARENIAAPLIVTGTSRQRALARADELLATVGLTDRAAHRPAKMSGGQQQRVALARALVHEPPMLLADEPTANLDYINAEAVIALLRELRSDGRVIIVSTHDERMVRVADRVVEMVKDFHGAAAQPQRVEYSSGETIFEQGSKGQLVYQIESGEIDIVRVGESGERLLAVLGAGQYFGELGPLLGFPRSATARAKSDVVLTAMGIREFRERVERGKSAAPPARSKPARKAPAKRKASAASSSRGRAPARKKTAARSAPAKKRAAGARRSSS